MASLVSSWSFSVKSLPEKYVLPVEKRPASNVPLGKEIPMIDLGLAAGNDRAETVQKIIKASQEFGLFQVINHGVSEKLMLDSMNVGKEFFAMSVEEKAKFCVDGAQKGCKLYTSSGSYCTQDFEYWKDSLQHPCHPLESHINTWPDKPKKYREIIGPYTVEVRKLGLRILDLIYTGLGYIEEEFDKYQQAFIINHYPACPDPSSALGIGGHCDANHITILQQDVHGLELFKDGQWIGVELLPNAFVINIGLTLEVISNGSLRSAVHRVVTNSACSRTSLATFVICASDAIVEPSKSLVDQYNPPLYRAFQNKDFLESFFSKNCNYEATLEHFKLDPK